jgi:hypothetical protein
MTNRNDQDLAARERSKESDDPMVDVLPAIEHFLLAVDRTVGERLSEDEIEARLQQVLRRSAQSHAPTPSPEWSMENPNWQAVAKKLAAYGYRIVEIWLQAILTGQYQVDLRREDIDELAKKTVARAINGFRNEVLLPGRVPAKNIADIDLREIFLAQCVRRLPEAYRSHLLGTDRLPLNDLEEGLLGQPGEGRMSLVIVRALWHCVTAGRDDTVHRVGHRVEDINEIIVVTTSAIGSAAQMDPGTIGRVTAP